MDAADPEDVSAAPRPELDYRFSLANERTYLAWVRTALALVAGGIAAAKALNFEHDLARWLVAAPPVLGGVLLAAMAPRRMHAYERAMRSDRSLPVGGHPALLAVGLAAYGVLALVVSAVDG